MFNNNTQRGFLILFFIFLPLLSFSFEIYSQKKTFQACNFTHFVYQNNISLARQDQLNRTFSKVAQKVTNLINITSIIDQKTSYQIYDVFPTFKFSNENQTAQIYGNDTFIYLNGQLKVQISFKWKKIVELKQELNGSGIVQIQSDFVIYAKQIVPIGYRYHYQLLDWLNVSFNSNQMNWVQLLPANTQAWDRALIYRAINNNSYDGTLRRDLQQKTNTYFSYYLRQLMNDPDDFLNDDFQYIWIDPVQQRGNLTIQFQKKLKYLEINKQDIQAQYEMKIMNWPNWKCGQIPSNLPLNPRVYGGSQQFISVSIFQNVLRYAIQKGRFDAILQRKYWQSELFNFTAGQLFQVIPKLSQNFKSNQQIRGNCTVQRNNFKLIFIPGSYFQDQNLFQVYLNLKCELSIQKQKFAQFNLQSWLMILGIPQRSFLQFKVNRVSNIVSYEKIEDYEIQNEILADKMISKSLGRIRDSNLFGSGWPLYPKRDQPQLIISSNSAIVYDRSTSPKINSK